MTTSEERMNVLRMLQEGRLEAEAAAQLLQALDEPAQPQIPPAPPVPAEPAEPVEIEAYSTPRWLRVRVTDTDTGRPRVNVRLPFGMVQMGLKLGARYAPEIEGVDLAELLAAAKTLEPGPFVDVYDEDDGEHVEVFLE